MRIAKPGGETGITVWARRDRGRSAAGIAQAAGRLRTVRSAVTSICRGGFFPAFTAAGGGGQAAIVENKRVHRRGARAFRRAADRTGLLGVDRTKPCNRRGAKADRRGDGRPIAPPRRTPHASREHQIGIEPQHPVAAGGPQTPSSHSTGQ